MQSATDDLKAGLINEILFADSHVEVERLIEVAIKETNPRSARCFIDNVRCDLELFNPMKEAAQQWSNIKLARILLIRKQAHYAATQTI